MQRPGVDHDQDDEDPGERVGAGQDERDRGGGEVFVRAAVLLTARA